MEEYKNKGRRYYIFWTLVRIILCIKGSWVWGCDVVISLVSGGYEVGDRARASGGR